jgi:hypothetical protein
MDDDDPPVSANEFLESIKRLTKDLRVAALTLSDREARYLTDSYYALQRDRIRAAHQLRTLAAGAEPHDVMQWVGMQRETLENQIRSALDIYSRGQITGVWARSITGVGPVIAAGLLANIDVTQAPTVGHIWRFCGLDPTVKWDKGTKRPWNGSLKRLCWLLGESFTKVSGRDSDVYGQVYKSRKESEIRRNEAGEYAEQAKASLAAKRFGDDTQAKAHYLAGHLPPARIHLRAQRYAVKLFLSDLHCVWFWTTYGTLPPKPYVISHLGHAHYTMTPNAEIVPGLAEALAASWPMMQRAPKPESDGRGLREHRAPRASGPLEGRAPGAPSESRKTREHRGKRARAGVAESTDSDERGAVRHESTEDRERKPRAARAPSARSAPRRKQ